jgi:hypothetical protein
MSITDSASISRQPYVIPAHRPSQHTKSTKPDLSLNTDTFIPQGKSGLIAAKGDVSPSHIRKADWILLALPPGLQKHFRDHDCQVKLAPTMGDIFPDTIGDFDASDRSKTRKRRCEEIRGCTREKVIGLPELIKPPEQDTFLPQTPPNRGLTVLRHELGHLLHNTSPLLYDQDGSNDDFSDAYIEDLENLSLQDRETFSYLIQTDDIENPSARGYKEAFAEVFASLYGGGCKDDEAVQKAFPNTTAYMKQAVKQLIATTEQAS